MNRRETIDSQTLLVGMDKGCIQALHPMKMICKGYVEFVSERCIYTGEKEIVNP